MVVGPHDPKLERLMFRYHERSCFSRHVQTRSEFSVISSVYKPVKELNASGSRVRCVPFRDRVLRLVRPVNEDGEILNIGL